MGPSPREDFRGDERFRPDRAGSASGSLQRGGDMRDKWASPLFHSLGETVPDWAGRCDYFAQFRVNISPIRPNSQRAQSIYADFFYLGPIFLPNQEHNRRINRRINA